MSIDWTRMMKGASVMAVTAALCVSVAAPANGADGGTVDTAGTAAAAEGTSVTDVKSFLNAVFPCKAGESKTVVIAADVNLTADNVSAYTAGVGNRMDMQCSLEIVSDGQAQHEITWTGGDSLFWPKDGGSVTIGRTGDDNANMLKFTSFQNSTAVAGPLFHNYGTLAIRGGEFSGLHADMGPVAFNAGTVTVTGGTFENNEAGGNGGVVYNNGGAVTVEGGTFTGNKAANGGVISSSNGTVAIKGGVFESNESTKNSGSQNGGGVIRLVTTQTTTETPGTLTVTGGTFTGNKVDAQTTHSGGGAIWAQGEVTISGGVYAHNYVKGNQAGWSGGGAIYIYSGNGSGWNAGNGETGYRSTLTVSRGTFLGNATHGGGGAIFLGWYSTAIFTGIRGQNAPSYGSVNPTTPVWFEGNTAEHLGGAVYTEEKTTTFMGQSVAYRNGAGHFGGGLWLCPSGQGFNSKGGNMLLFENTVNSEFDVSVTQDATNRPKNTRDSSWGAVRQRFRHHGADEGRDHQEQFRAVR